MVSWRLEELSGGSLVWLYMRPHEVTWAEVELNVLKEGLTVTEERQNLVDEQLGACIRYLCVRR